MLKETTSVGRRTIQKTWINTLGIQYRTPEYQKHLNTKIYSVWYSDGKSIWIPNQNADILDDILDAIFTIQIKNLSIRSPTVRPNVYLVRWPKKNLNKKSY